MRTNSRIGRPLPERSLVHLTYVCPHCGVTGYRMLQRGTRTRLPCIVCSGLADLYAEVSAAFGPVRSEEISQRIAGFRLALEYDDD